MDQVTAQRHVVGQTKDVGFQIGVRRTFATVPQHAWNVLTSNEGIKLWLGDAIEFQLKPGTTYQTREGIVGEVRVVKPGGHFRVTWQPEHWQQASTIQVRIIPRSGKTVVSFHQEHLLSEQERNQMQQRWQTVLEKLQLLLDS
jgi:uncharacterized protein YndB with AHSA1/START domain